MSEAVALERLLIELVPEGSAVAACAVHDPDAGSRVASLSEDERAIVGSAVPARLEEFAAGRWCAHRALAALQADVATVGRGPRRQPVWPSGVTGSISHASGLAVAVARAAGPAAWSIGLDVERIGALTVELWPDILTPAEHDACDAADDPDGVATAVFSAKEAAFKAVYPVHGREVGFLDAVAEHDGSRVTAVVVASLGARLDVQQGSVGTVVASVAVLGSVVPERAPGSGSSIGPRLS